MAEVKRALERSVSKDASHLSKRLEAQTLTFTQCRTLLHFIQIMARVRVRVRVPYISPISPLHLPDAAAAARSNAGAAGGDAG